MRLRIRYQRGRGMVACLACLIASSPFGTIHPPSLGGPALSESSQVVATKSSLWPVGEPRPIAVRSDRARFVVPTRAANDRTLVIVSVLARTPGRYSVRISARPAAQPESPEIADDGVIRTPARTPPIPPNVIRPPQTEPPKLRTFHIPVRDGDPVSRSNYVAVNAHLHAFSPSVQVYVDANDRQNVDEPTIREIVRTFDDHILPMCHDTIGVASDVDRDGRFTILLSGWLGHLADGRLSVDGYIRGADFELLQAPPIGNRGDVMYLNASLKRGPHLQTVMAHEYTHAVTYCRKALGLAGRDEEGWLDEAISYLAEDLHGFSRTNLDHRVEAFLAEPGRYRLLVQDFAEADLIRSHGHRGAAYRFVRWCADHHGPDLFRKLVLSDRCGVPNLELATGRSFAALYRGWSIDLFLSALRPRSDAIVVTPRVSRVVPGRDDDRAMLDSTTTHYAIVDGAETGAVEVIVTGIAGSQMQVTAVPLPGDYPRVDLNVGGDSAIVGNPGLVARIRERDGRRVEMMSLGWTSDGEDPRRTPETTILEGERLRDRLGPAMLNGREWRVSRPIPIAKHAKSADRHVRLVGRDERGRTVVSWSEDGRQGGSAEEPAQLGRILTPSSPTRAQPSPGAAGSSPR